MRTFLINPRKDGALGHIFKESALRPILSSSRDVSLYIYLYICLSVCPLPMQFLFRPLIGPHIT